MTLLAVTGLTVAAGERRLVDAVSFAIAPGEVLGLVGESGSGKSLTALALAGLLPEGIAVTGGRADFAGQRLTGLTERGWRALRGRRIAMVFQDPMASLNPFMTAGAQVMEALRQHHAEPSAALRARCDRLFREVGLDAALHPGRRPHQLSGGQQQRVVIAMALAGDPELLLADEPTTALDAAVQAQILALLRRLVADRGLAMLFISHDLGVVASVSQRVGVMRHGRLLEIGPVGRVLRAPSHPYTRELVDARSRLAGEVRAAASGEEVVLRVEGLAVAYPGQGAFAAPRRVVVGVDLTLARGEAFCLLGASGSGKSSVARALMGLAARPAGRVELTGRVLPPGLAARRDPLSRRIQMVFQNPYSSLNPRLTVLQALTEPLMTAGVPRAEWRARAGAALAEVGLAAEHLDRHPHALSGGQRQRVAIARALLADPAVLVCDEVLSALDASVQGQVLALLQRLRRERRLAVLFITHDLGVARYLGGQVGVMAEGRIVERGDTAEVLDNPRHAMTQGLLAAEALPPAA